jgi:hypothetical protein
MCFSFFILPAQSHQYIYLSIQQSGIAFSLCLASKKVINNPHFHEPKTTGKLNDTLLCSHQSDHAFPPRLQQHHNSTIQCSTFTHPTSQDRLFEHCSQQRGKAYFKTQPSSLSSIKTFLLSFQTFKHPSLTNTLFETVQNRLSYQPKTLQNTTFTIKNGHLRICRRDPPSPSP